MRKKAATSIIILAFSTQIWAEEQKGPLETIGGQLDQIITEVADHTYIISKLSEDPLLSPYEIKVVIDENNIAYISGEVDTDIQYDRAIMIVSSMDKIEDVDTKNFKVKKSDSILDDVSITAKIKGKILKEKYVEGLDISFWPIEIETKNGDVYITGEVKSQNDANNILNIAESIKGVRSVRSDLKVTIPMVE